MLLIDIRSTNASEAEFILDRLKLYLAGRHHHNNIDHLFRWWWWCRPAKYSFSLSLSSTRLCLLSPKGLRCSISCSCKRFDDTFPQRGDFAHRYHSQHWHEVGLRRRGTSSCIVAANAVVVHPETSAVLEYRDLIKTAIAVEIPRRSLRSLGLTYSTWIKRCQSVD